MKRIVTIGLAALAAGVWLAGPALAAGHRNVLPEGARAAPEGRAVVVLTPQAELSSNINPSMVDVAMGGGVLGVLIDAKIDSDRSKKAESLITPIRASLHDFDADQLAIDTVHAAVEGVPWFQAKAEAFGRDNSPPSKSDLLSASAAGQVAFFECIYDTAPDFGSIRVAVTFSLANKAAPAGAKPESRLSGKNLVFVQTVTSVVQLDNPGAADANAARWSANGGALARKALTLAFADTGRLVPRALVLTDDDVKRMGANGERKTIAHVSGRSQEEGPDGTLLFNGGLIHVQTLKE